MWTKLLFLSSLIFLAHSAPTPLQFNSNGTFTIIQFTDTHFGMPNATADDETVKAMSLILDHEKPDLAVLSGDMISAEYDKGQDWFSDQWAHMVSPMLQKNVPWAFTMGNHDGAGELSGKEIIELDKTYDLSFTEMGPPELFGVTNYRLDILGYGGESKKASIWIFDSGCDKCLGIPAPHGGSGWSCVRPDQIVWFMNENDRSTPSIAVFHIPLHEIMWAYDYNVTRGTRKDHIR